MAHPQELEGRQGHPGVAAVGLRQRVGQRCHVEGGVAGDQGRQHGRRAEEVGLPLGPAHHGGQHSRGKAISMFEHCQQASRAAREWAWAAAAARPLTTLGAPPCCAGS